MVILSFVFLLSILNAWLSAGSFRKRRYQNDPPFTARQGGGGARGSSSKRKKSPDDAGSADDMSQGSLDNMMSIDFEAKAATPTPSSASGSSSPRKTVKLSIKSFTVPELLIDMPESATVASLKKAVLDATMNLLGGGLRIRVFLHGKRVPDEEATLAQVGLSAQAGKSGSLGFMLEPASSSNSEDALLALSQAASQPGTWHPTLDGSWAVVEGQEKMEDTVIETDARLACSLVSGGGGDGQAQINAKWTGTTTHLLCLDGCHKNNLRTYKATRVTAAGGMIFHLQHTRTRNKRTNKNQERITIHRLFSLFLS
ncbi:uncharacterized protein LOC112347786 [Selaginella moellendorffii]|uniref:uncharacterized protein LOC112347786 n=1 Tax=Selaginella moellendorffii TaxID=88036 RepID=UPI000D1CA7AE|nr:uncharacterized protein LOC112347786 [Selaginella moellendorffii]|eukprot:XP_024534957.1 uncharacterized protein LOC112347786 [Selaginella moellendorffii]